MRRGSRRARPALRVVSTILGLALLGGCGGDDGTDASLAGRGLPDCSESGCADEVAAYAEAVGELPGVQDLDISYREEQITAGAAVIGDLTVGSGASCSDLEDELGRLLWESAINPVSAVRLQCYLPGASGSDYDDAGYSFLLKDADELTARWGPRGG
ncbi:hypothetical protein BH09ACT12_BH09ACT12_31550 [soil metagenome]